MGIYFPDTMFAGVVLVRSAMRSPNYVAGVSGWTINQDGTVEFNNGVFRGTLIIGTTTVTTVGTTGITVAGPDQTMTIFNSSGFRVVKTVADGRMGQIDLTTSTGNGSASRLFLRPITPTAAANVLSTTTGVINAFITGAGGAEAGVWQILSPSFSGKANSSIQMLGQTGGSGVDDSVIFLQASSVQSFANLAVTGNLSASGTLAITGGGDIDGSLRLGPNNQEIGQGAIVGAHSLANSAAVGAVETTVLTSNSGTFRAGHTYRVTVYGEVTTSVVGLANNPVIRIRKTLAGQQLGQSRFYCPVVTTGFPGGFTLLFDVAGTDVTTTLVMTIQGAAGFNATSVASGTNGRGFYVEDIGSAFNAALDSANVVTLT